MKNLNHVFVIATLFVAASCAFPSTQSDEIILFAENAADWSTEGIADWSFTEGVLVARLDSGAGFITSKESYSDFELTLEFNPDSTINSGVYVRCGGEETTPKDCYEINIWDLHPNQEYRTGAVVLKANPLAFVTTLNKWNTYRIRCEAGRIQAWVNGEQTADLKDDAFSGGYIALQAAENGEVRFRNVVVKKLE